MTEQDIKSHKAAIRSLYAQKRNAWPDEQRAQWSKAASEHAIRWLEKQQVQSFMVYIAFRSELDLKLLIEWGWREDKEVIVPRCVAKDRSMTLHYLRNWDELIVGSYGIQEPNPAATLPLDDGYVPEAVFVPGLAFNGRGGRIGYGGGYYDRFAEILRDSTEQAQQPIWVGAGFDGQRAEDIPYEWHDLRMDYVLTEQGIQAAEQLAEGSRANGIDAF